MIQPIIAQTAPPVANMQHHIESQSALHGQQAENAVKKEEMKLRETVVQKDEAVFYEQRHDASEEGKNKYANLYSKKRKKNGEAVQEEKESVRVNFNIQI